ncbi:two-component system sensor histidine kinase NtrB [Pyxidicoccus xibeiensis]|uniref:two-component system sensor histidine kinase NtrB n=1 Tax=Pyxidicoccus xibeiensis TaxID=2906759 RepID=UPI0020A6EB46|nr:HAMP domain-containing sensor histidine kinase [Pyxidicoccus xibeiensis]MCP3139716.1 HAMP domain-containing histidine kinase [Pyxidicoccus xibeiensis]
MLAPLPPHDAVRAAQVRAVGTAFLRLRPRLVAPAMGVTALVLWRTGVPSAQLRVLAVGMTLLLGFFTWEAWRGRARDFPEAWLFRSLLLTTVGITAGCAVTGGLASPLLPMLFAPVVTTFAAFGLGREGTGALVATVLLSAGLGALPPDVPFPRLPSPQAEWLRLLFLLVSLLLLRASVAGLTEAWRRSGALLERLRAESLDAAEARAAALESMGASVAHELKNPLSSVKGLVQLLARSASEPKARERLAVVQSEVERMEAILQEYVSFARPLGALRPTDTLLEPLLEDVVSVVEGRAREAGVRVEPTATRARAHVDARRLKEALLNLTLNAIEATPTGGTVALGVEDSGGRVILTVRDTGRGMSPEVLARLGTPFFTTREAGTGLGVVLARAVAVQHGGTLDYESHPGQGTVARLALPPPDEKGGPRHGEGPAGR